MSDHGLRIRVLRRPDDAHASVAGSVQPVRRLIQPGLPSIQPAAPRRERPIGVRRGSHRTTGPAPRLNAVQSRVREALRCPYCREDIAAPEETGAGALHGSGLSEAERRTRTRDVTTLLAVTCAGALGWITAFLAQWPIALALSGAVAGGGLIHLVLTRPLFLLGRRILAETRALRTGIPTGPDDGTVGCARRGCGALYHAECWEECRTSYGACAVFGCGSQEAHSVSGVAHQIRIARLFLAALIFTPRVIQALREDDGEGGSGNVAAVRDAIRQQARDATDNMWASTVEQRDTRWKNWLNALQMATVIGGSLAGALLGFGVWGHNDPMALFLMIGIPTALVVALRLISWPFALLIYGAKAILAGEFAALSRLGNEGSFLSKVKLAGGGKKG